MSQNDLSREPPDKLQKLLSEDMNVNIPKWMWIVTNSSIGCHTKDVILER